ncbi:MAG: sugar transferase [Pseudomonadota bacterium]
MRHHSGSERYARSSATPSAKRSANRRSGLKRAFDLAVAAPALLFFAPLLLCLWLTIRLQDGEDAIFRQARVGADGEVFELLKFRSMVIDAPMKLQAHLDANPTAAHEWARYQKLKSDPRITPIGGFVRKTSLDELPQLWNIIKGDMSIVGPRPILISQIDKHGDHFDAYKSVKPGVTGLWQINGRNETSFEERAKFDAEYAANWSFWLDLKIFLQTIPIVLFSRGAY